MAFPFLAIFFVLSVQAQPPEPSGSCDFKRLDARGGSMEHVTIRDQDGLGNCYAQTAAQLVDAYRFSHGDSRYDFQTSAVMASIQYSQERNEKEVWGGSVCPSVDLISARGACRHNPGIDTLYSQSDNALRNLIAGKITFEKFSKGLGYDWQNFKDSTSFYLKKLYQATRYPETVSMPPQFPGSQLGYTRYNLKNLFSPSTESIRFQAVGLCQITPSLPMNSRSIEAVQKALSESENPVQVLANLEQELCSGKNRLSYSVPRCSDSWGRESNLNFILNRLDSPNAQPAGIGFCSNVLDEGRSYKKCDDASFHAALIIGKRKNPATGRCQLLLRNSWGLEWCPHSDFECDRGKGSAWIDADKLLRSSNGISYIP